MVEQKAEVAMMDIEQSELDRVTLAFGYTLVSHRRLTGGCALPIPPARLRASARTPARPRASDLRRACVRRLVQLRGGAQGGRRRRAHRRA